MAIDALMQETEIDGLRAYMSTHMAGGSVDLIARRKRLIESTMDAVSRDEIIVLSIFWYAFISPNFLLF